MKSKAVFKTYNQDQLSLFPLSYDELVPKNHPVRLTSTNDPTAHVELTAIDYFLFF
jgi:transposase